MSGKIKIFTDEPLIIASTNESSLSNQNNLQGLSLEPQPSSGTNEQVKVLGIGDTVRQFLGYKEVSTDTIKNSLKEFTNQLGVLFKDIREVGDFDLKTVQVEVEINAAGEVGFCGLGKSSLGTKGAITLVFEAPSSKPAK